MTSAARPAPMHSEKKRLSLPFSFLMFAWMVLIKIPRLMFVALVLVWINRKEHQNIKETDGQTNYRKSCTAGFRLIGVVFFDGAINVSVFISDFNGKFCSVHSFTHRENQIASDHAFDLRIGKRVFIPAIPVSVFKTNFYFYYAAPRLL
jgi:hypothetical protein